MNSQSCSTQAILPSTTSTPLLYRISNPQNMGQACNCNNTSYVQESTIDPKPPKINHRDQRTSLGRFQFLLDDKDLFMLPSSMPTIDNSSLGTFSLIQPMDDDFSRTSTSTNSTNESSEFLIINLDDSNSQNNPIQPSSSNPDRITIPSQETFEFEGYEEDIEDIEYSGNEDDNNEEDVKHTPNLFRNDTNAKWNFSDIVDLENEIKQELQSMKHYDIVVGKFDQVS